MNHQNQKSERNSLLKNRFRRFANDCIADRSELCQLSDFPDDIWLEMANQKLFGIRLDAEFNGHGGSARSLVHAGKTLVQYGGNIGVAMSWLIHEVVASWLIMRFGSEAQKNIYLPKLAAGEKTFCFAVSEPETGSHPKHIKTHAKPVSDGYCLNGEKTYLTNGPIADFFTVIAVTGQQSGKNQFTAFIVPKDSPGLEVTDPISFPFLHPCPHGGIRLVNCLVKQEHVLGNIGDAYEKMVLPFRTVEDTLMTGLITGGLNFLLSYLIDHLKQNPADPDDLVISELAQFKCALDGLAAISDTAAERLDESHDKELPLTLGLFFRSQAIDTLKKIEQIIEKTGIKPDHKIIHMIDDLSALLRIAENVSKIKLNKLGKSLFNEPEFPAE